MNVKNIGIIGVGGIACGRHIPELLNINNCKITAICDIDDNRLKTIGNQLNIPVEMRFTNYNDLINCNQVDAIEICTPNHMHVPIAAAAAIAKKPFNIEKPLSINLHSCKPLQQALQESSVPNMMSFTYRFMPAIRYAKWLITNGYIGEVLNVDVEYFKDSGFIKGRRLEWRFQKDKAGTGVLGDLGVHLIDMAELLAGKITSVCGFTDIIVKERQKLGSDEWAPVETDDYCSFICNIQNGVRGNFVISRCAMGKPNSVKFDVYGSKGTICFNMNNPNILDIYSDMHDEWNKKLITIDVPKEFHTTQEAEFVKMLYGKKDEIFPTVEDGLRSQKILDAILESSEKHCWVVI